MGGKGSKNKSLHSALGSTRSNSATGHYRNPYYNYSKPSTSQQSQTDSEHSCNGATTVAPTSTGYLSGLNLTPYQKDLVRLAWKRMNKKGISSNIGSQVFRCMLEKSPEMKLLFQHVAVIEGVFSFGLTPIQSYHHHSTYFIDLLDDVVNCLDDLTPVIPRCNEFGAKHVRYVVYGFKMEFWDVFGEAMISAAREWEGWKKHRETLRAWTILVSFIVDRMRQGYESGVKRLGYTTSAAANSAAGAPGDPMTTASTGGSAPFTVAHLASTVVAQCGLVPPPSAMAGADFAIANANASSVASCSSSYCGDDASTIAFEDASSVSVLGEKSNDTLLVHRPSSAYPVVVSQYQ